MTVRDETIVYDKRCQQIAAEMFMLMKLVRTH